MAVRNTWTGGAESPGMAHRPNLLFVRCFVSDLHMGRLEGVVPNGTERFRSSTRVFGSRHIFAGFGLCPGALHDVFLLFQSEEVSIGDEGDALLRRRSRGDLRRS